MPEVSTGMHANASVARSLAGARAGRGALECLPKWLNLVPMVLQWCWLGLRYRSVTLPSAANPAITTGGLVGDGKAEYFAGMGQHARSITAPFAMLQANGDDALAQALMRMHATGLTFPIVVKPERGWCGFGVQRIDNTPQLAVYLAGYPRGEPLMLQRHLDEPGEAGIFYARMPGQATGRICGIVLRHYPQVIGDGTSTVSQLIAADPRLRRAHRSRRHRFRCDLAQIPPAGQSVRLSLIGSIRAGGRYEDGSELAGGELTVAVDAIARDMPHFHVGRFDVRYASVADLRQGRFRIMEVNGAGSEAVYAWDPKYSLREAYLMVFAKQRMLFEMGAANRARGHRPVGALALARHFLRQQKLIRRYPPSN